LPHTDHPSEALVFDRTNESLSIRIQVARHRRRPDDLSPTFSDKSPALLRVLRIAINDQVTFRCKRT
jgi:hypothetical protein